MIAQTAISPSVVRDYIALTKPRIVSLLLVTALGAMFLASKGAPDPTIAAVLLTAGALAAGGAQSLNHALERDIDAQMKRTKDRPVAGGRVPPRNALAFGLGLNVVAFVMLVAFANALAAVVTLSGTLIYVFVYTMALKRSTPQNIVIGGAAGAVPPIAGWAAVTGTVELPAIFMFTIIFLWTPPHFWALALLIKDDYERAGIPMLPVVTSLAATKRAILLYSAALAAAAVLFAAHPSVGWVYLVSSAGLSAAFVFYAYRLTILPGIRGARTLYLYSLLYLALLFLSIIVDSVLT